MSVICDWLDVTFDPENSPLRELTGWLLFHGFFASSATETETGSKTAWEAPDGSKSLHIHSCSAFARVSASGSILAFLRANNRLLEYCSILASCPHRVTRLDAALDIPKDGADWLADWRASHPEPSFPLYRNKLPVTYMTCIREDGRESGTVYFGHRTRARITARVYDKALQVYQQSDGRAIMQPTTRIEVTRRKDATLRDACEPTAMFWSIAGAIIDRPANVPEWVTADMSPSFPRPPARLPHEVLRRGVETDAHLAALIRVADGMPRGREALLNLLRQYVQNAPHESDSAA